MKTYILDSINRIKRLGENLDAKTILCNKSWQIFNAGDHYIAYIYGGENGPGNWKDYSKWLSELFANLDEAIVIDLTNDCPD